MEKLCRAREIQRIAEETVKSIEDMLLRAIEEARRAEENALIAKEKARRAEAPRRMC